MSMKVSFLGTGRMGAAMALHVLAAGHGLMVWNRSPERVEPLRRLGAAVGVTPAAAVAGCDVAVLMLTDATAVCEVLFAAGGVADGATAGMLVVDGSTVGPEASRAVAERLGGHGVRYVDAPVCGSVDRAAAGTLGVFLGGVDVDVAQARPVVKLWGEPDQVRHVGPVGAGNAAKLVRNLTLGLAIVGIGEALRLAAALGLPSEVAFQAVAAGPLAATIPGVRAMDAPDPAPAAFTIDMLTKDLALCLAGAPDLPLTAAARSVGERIARAGSGDGDSRTLALHLRDGR